MNSKALEKSGMSSWIDEEVAEQINECGLSRGKGEGHACLLWKIKGWGVAP